MWECICKLIHGRGIAGSKGKGTRILTDVIEWLPVAVSLQLCTCLFSHSFTNTERYQTLIFANLVDEKWHFLVV